MPVVIEDFEAEITPETEPGGGGGAAAPAAAADVAAVASQPGVQAWRMLRDLSAEREARLAAD